MPAPCDPSTLSRAELILLLSEQQRQIADLSALLLQQRERIEELMAVVKTQQMEMERLRRGGQRQAAPFSKGVHKSSPKKPGRKPGSGEFTRRSAPCIEAITEIIDAPVKEGACPQCGGLLEQEPVELVTTTDIPPLVLPAVTGFRVQVCRCTHCGQRVRGQHPRLAPDHYGATAHRVGPRVMAMGHWLHYGLGIPLRKVPAVLLKTTGVEIGQSALTQDALRQAKGAVGEVYQQLRATIRLAPFVHTDDTGWRVAGNNAQLMVFETPKVAVYQIRDRHRNEEVREVIPEDYQGTLITDRGRSYDARELEEVKQSKCLSHVQRSIDAVIQNKEQQGEPVPEFCVTLKALLKQANTLWHMYQDSPSRWFRLITFPLCRARLIRALTEHLWNRQLEDPDCQRLLNELGRHHARGNLVRFLVDPALPPTNNAAERALRPAVIARKVSQCSKNSIGSEAFCAFTSVLRTAVKQGLDPIQVLCQLSSASPR